LLAGQSGVPEPGTLGLLALGSLGLSFWRRRKQEPVASDR
jgi:PEP-CTERM motif